jgi:hypothetical protein
MSLHSQWNCETARSQLSGPFPIFSSDEEAPFTPERGDGTSFANDEFATCEVRPMVLNTQSSNTLPQRPVKPQTQQQTPRASRAVTLVLAAAAVATFTPNTNAVTLQFFGEDNASGALPVPNAAAAEAAFLANLSGVGTETFESAPLGSANGFISNFAGAGSATFTGNMSIISGTSTGTFPISGSRQMEGFANSFAISFSNPVAAFGFYATDVGDVGGNLTLTYANGPVTVINVSQLIRRNGNAFYFGYINTENPFTGVTFSNSNTTDRFGYDNMTIGSVQQVSAVPDSGATVAMLGLGLLGIMGVRRKFAV